MGDNTSNETDAEWIVFPLFSNPFEKRVLLVAIIVLVLGHVAFLTAIIHAGPGVFMTIGAGLLDGSIPYVDYIDHKPPGIYFLLAGLFTITRSAFAAKLVVLITNLLAAGSVYWLGKKVIDSKSGLVAVVLFLAASLVYGGPHVYTEPFVALFGLFGLYSFLIAERTGRRRYVLITGLCVGLAVLFKQPGLTFLGAIGAYLLLTFRERGVRDIVFNGGTLMVGTAVPLVATAALFASWNAVRPLFYWSLLVHFVGDTYATSLVTVLFGNLIRVAKFPLFWTLGLAGAALVVRDRSNLEVALLGMFALFSIVPLAIRGWSHYYLLPAPFVALVSAYAVYQTARVLDPVYNQAELQALFFSGLLILALPFVLNVATETQTQVVERSLSDDQQLGTYLRDRTSPDEPILTLGEQAKYYFLSDREPMNKHLYYLSINRPLYSQNALVQNLERKQVAYVVINQPCHPEIKRVCKHVMDTYELERTDGSLQVYRRAGI